MAPLYSMRNGRAMTGTGDYVKSKDLTPSLILNLMVTGADLESDTDRLKTGARNSQPINNQ
jgi:hypothetical protein